MSEFTKLLGELGAEATALAKSLPSGEAAAEDKTVAAAAAEGAAASAATAKPGEKPGAEGGEAAPAAAAAGDDAVLGKSMTLTDAAGNPLEVVDGTEMVKSLLLQVKDAKSDLAAVMPVIQGQAALLKAQNATITALTGRVGDMQKALDAYANGGTGRRTVLTSAAPGADGGAQNAQPGGIDMTKALGGFSAKEFLGKSLEAMKGGKISGDQLRMAETTINHGQPMNPEFVKLVLGAQ